MKKSGFTLIELLVTIAILAIVLAIGVPNFNGMIRSSAMRANSSDILSAFNYARMEAVKRGSSVHLGKRNKSTWEGGLVVWVDATPGTSDVFDAGEELRLWEPLSVGASLTSTNTHFVFSAQGVVDHVDTLSLCDDRTGETGRTISVLKSGAAYAEENNGCL